MASETARSGSAITLAEAVAMLGDSLSDLATGIAIERGAFAPDVAVTGGRWSRYLLLAAAVALLAPGYALGRWT